METLWLSVPHLSSPGCVMANRAREYAKTNLIVTLNNRIRFRFHIMQFVGHDLRARIRHIADYHEILESVLRVRVTRGARLQGTFLSAHLPVLTMWATVDEITREVVTSVDLVVRPAMGRVQARLRLLVVVGVRSPMFRYAIQRFSALSMRGSQYLTSVVQTLNHVQGSQCECRPRASVSKVRRDVHLVLRVIQAGMGVPTVARWDASATTLYVRVARIRLFAKNRRQSSTSSLRSSRHAQVRADMVGHVSMVEIFRVGHVTCAYLRTIFLIKRNLGSSHPVGMTVIIRRINTCFNACFQVSHEGRRKEVNNGPIRRPISRAFLVTGRAIVDPRLRESKSGTWGFYAQDFVRYNVGFNRNVLYREHL